MAITSKCAMFKNYFSCENEWCDASQELDLLLNTAGNVPLQTECRYLVENEKSCKIIRKRWRQAEDILLCSSAAGTVNLPSIRSHLLSYLNVYSCSCLVEDFKESIIANIDLLNGGVLRWSDFEEDILVKLTSGSDRNDSLITYFHMYLESQWFSLIIYYKCVEYNKCTDLLKGIIKDLVAFYYTYYKKQQTNNLLEISAQFPCKCTERFVLLLEQLGRRINVDLQTYFNETLTEDYGLFNLWLFRHLHVLRDDVTLLESTLRILNNTSDINYVIVMQLIESGINSSSSPYQLFWEYFNKQIGNDFGVAADNPRQLLQLKSSKSSFHYFLSLLDGFLERNPSQWARLKGRIYSKLPLHKFKELTDYGLANITQLFLILAKRERFTELAGKLQTSLQCLPAERKKTKLVFNAYLALILLHIENEVDVEVVCKNFAPLIEEAVDNKETLHLLPIVFNGIEEIINCNRFNLNQQHLFGVWLKTYMSNCTNDDSLHYALNVLNTLVEKVIKSENDCLSEWMEMFNTWLLPGLKQVNVINRAPLQVGGIAAKINRNSNESLTFFTNEWISPSVTASYLCTFLDQCAIGGCTNRQENVIIQAWVRCCLVNNQLAPKLADHIFQFQRFRLLQINRSNYNNPMCDLIKTFNREMKTNAHAKELCDLCFSTIDSFVANQLIAPTSEGHVLHMYTCFALLFFYCSPLLYQRNRASSLLEKLTAVLLLPTGRALHPFTLKAVMRTWHLYVQGLYSIDDNDPHLERIIADLVAVYFVHMKANDHPMIKCFYQEGIARLLLEKTTQNFLSTKTCDENSRKVFQLIEAGLVDHFATVVGSTLALILECIMNYSDKEQPLKLLKSIVDSTCYDAGAKQSLRETIIKMTEKHLAFNASNYFQLVGVLAKLVPVDVRTLLPIIKKQVGKTEQMRGVGHDTALRQGYERIETLLLDF